MIFADLLPERSIEDAIAGRVKIELGGQAFTLPALSIEDNETWCALFEGKIQDALAGLGSIAKPATVIAYLGTQHELLWELLAAYDRTGVLPAWAALRSQAKRFELMRAVLAVAAAEYPLVVTVLELASTQPEALRVILARALEAGSPPSTSSSLPNTAGPSVLSGVS